MDDIKKGMTSIVAVATVLVAMSMTCRSLAVETIYPVEKAKRAFVTRVWSRISALWSASATGAENKRLKREVASLAMAASDVERLEAENARLRAALEYQAKEPGKWLASAVLSSGGASAGVKRTIRLDRGSLAGVREGAAVAVPEGLVGRVASVTPHTAEVLLLTDPACKVACIVEGTNMRGILSGAGGEHLALEFTTPGATAGDFARVMTSGLGGLFPAGIEVGRLKFAGTVESAVDFAALEDVFIRK